MKIVSDRTSDGGSGWSRRPGRRSIGRSSGASAAFAGSDRAPYSTDESAAVALANRFSRTRGWWFFEKREVFGGSAFGWIQESQPLFVSVHPIQASAPTRALAICRSLLKVADFLEAAAAVSGVADRQTEARASRLTSRFGRDRPRAGLLRLGRPLRARLRIRPMIWTRLRRPADRSGCSATSPFTSAAA